MLLHQAAHMNRTCPGYGYRQGVAAGGKAGVPEIRQRNSILVFSSASSRSQYCDKHDRCEGDWQPCTRQQQYATL